MMICMIDLLILACFVVGASVFLTLLLHHVAGLILFLCQVPCESQICIHGDDKEASLGPRGWA